MNDVLILEDVYKNYNQANMKIEILQGINLNVKKGEIVGIVGASGSGKSTLLHIAGLLDNADSGNIYINNNHISPNNSSLYHKIRLKNLGYVYQYHHLLKDFSALENIMLPMLINGKTKAYAREKASHLLERFGLQKKHANFPGELSGGEQQRVAIARALSNSPTLVLADEPTGNLDPKTAEEVFDIFLENAKEKGTAIIIVTHNYELAKKMHRVLTLVDKGLK